MRGRDQYNDRQTLLGAQRMRSAGLERYLSRHERALLTEHDTAEAEKALQAGSGGGPRLSGPSHAYKSGGSRRTEAYSALPELYEGW